jgi:hypothetical protein
MPSCAGLGRLTAEGKNGPPDFEAAIALLDRACKAGEKIACQDAGAIANDDLADPGRAAGFLERGCVLDDAVCCGVLAIFHMQGVGVEKDEKKSIELLDKSCKLGRADACEAANDLRKAQNQRVAGANVTVDSMEADGLAVRRFECRVDGGGGLFGSLALVGLLAAQKKGFDKCAPKGAAPDVFWSFRAGKTVDVRVEDPDAKVAACVTKVMSRVKATMEAQCAATILVGERTAAEAAAAAKAGGSP